MSIRPEGDAGCLWDIRVKAADLQTFLHQKARADDATDRLLQSAFERNLEIIGEAPRQLTESFRLAHAEIPWSDIIGMRNILAHSYGRVDARRVWETATVFVPKLIVALSQIEEGR